MSGKVYLSESTISWLPVMWDIFRGRILRITQPNLGVLFSAPGDMFQSFCQHSVSISLPTHSNTIIAILWLMLFKLSRSFINQTPTSAQFYMHDNIFVDSIVSFREEGFSIIKHEYVPVVWFSIWDFHIHDYRRTFIKSSSGARELVPEQKPTDQ